MRTYVSLVVLSLMMLVSAVASAHPGHGVHEPGGLTHSLIEHPLAIAALAVAVVAGGAYLLRRRRSE